MSEKSGMRVGFGDPTFKAISDLVSKMNAAIPNGAQEHIVIAALFFMIRKGLTGPLASKLEAFDAYTSNIRTEIVADDESPAPIQ